MKTKHNAIAAVAGLICAGTAFGAAIASSLPVMTIALFGGLIATASSFKSKATSSVN
jgi:hypothetical protein